MDDLLDDLVPPAKPRRRRLLSPVLIVSVILHLLFAGAAALYVVSRYSAHRQLTFHGGPKSPNPSEQALLHRVQMEQKKTTQTLPASVPKRVLTTGLAKVALPPMPEMPTAKEGLATMTAAAAGGNFGSANRLTNPTTLGGNGLGPPINFFGIRDLSSSVVIMIDVSNSMFTRTGDAEKSKLVKLGKEQSFQAVRDEAIKLVQSLGPNVRFGIVRWAGNAYSWQPELVPATDENKAAAIEHIQTGVDMNKAKPIKGIPGGTRHDLALTKAFELKPEVIYMLTDGNATRSQPGGGLHVIPEAEIFEAAEAGQKTLSKRARLHVIYYLTGEDKAEEREMLTTLASRNGGKFQQVEARGRRER